jgi:hypothetical protein
VQTAIISLDETCIAKMVQAKTKLTWYISAYNIQYQIRRKFFEMTTCKQVGGSQKTPTDRLACQGTVLTVTVPNNIADILSIPRETGLCNFLRSWIRRISFVLAMALVSLMTTECNSCADPWNRINGYGVRVVNWLQLS